jgi:obg-like ATPase 1
VDIAGLVRGASQGAGLGNAFLSNVASVDAIYHLVRAFDNDDITHVESTIDPIRDLEIIQNELRIKDEEMLERQLMELAKLAKFPDAKKLAVSRKDELKTVEAVAEFMAKGRDVRKGDWSALEVNVINGLHLLTAKPMVYLCNTSEQEYVEGKYRYLPQIQQWVDENNKGDLVIPLSVSLESKLADMASQQEAEEYLKGLKVESQLPKVILAGYKALDLIHYFTCGPQEVRAWTVRVSIYRYIYIDTDTKINSTTEQLESTSSSRCDSVSDRSSMRLNAQLTHENARSTDFERGFISADIMKMNDLKELGSEAAVKSAGKYLQKGKDYVMEDGDIAHFKVKQQYIIYMYSFITDNFNSLMASDFYNMIDIKKDTN